jgi:hypothetical protein
MSLLALSFSDEVARLREELVKLREDFNRIVEEH